MIRDSPLKVADQKRDTVQVAALDDFGQVVAL